MNGLTPLTAVTADDPYPYYERLVAEQPFYRDDALGMWIASSAAKVESVLRCESLRVRPPAEPVPQALLGTPAGDVFARLVRQNDGPYHAVLRDAVVAALRDTAPACAEHAERFAESWAENVLTGGPQALGEYAAALPALVFAALLGLPANDETVAEVRHFARAIAPGASSEEIETGGASTQRLRVALASLLDARPPALSLLGRLHVEARVRHIDESDAIANAVGFLFQGYDATAALIGNTLLALARASGHIRDAARGDSSYLGRFVAEVARHDAPVQNTRRFAAAGVDLMGWRVEPGETVLTILAAANRDGSANPEPGRFNPDRQGRRTYTFGAGVHACPGVEPAIAIAAAGVAALLAREFDPAPLHAAGYRPSFNVRSPILAATVSYQSAPSPTKQ